MLTYSLPVTIYLVYLGIVAHLTGGYCYGRAWRRTLCGYSCWSWRGATLGSAREEQPSDARGASRLVVYLPGATLA